MRSHRVPHYKWSRSGIGNDVCRRKRHRGADGDIRSLVSAGVRQGTWWLQENDVVWNYERIWLQSILHLVRVRKKKRRCFDAQPLDPKEERRDITAGYIIAPNPEPLNLTGGSYSHNGVMVYPRIPIELERISWVCGISKLESQLQNWGSFKNSRSSDHYALDHRSWDCYINLQTHDISIERGANRFSWQRYAWCDDGVCIEKASQHAITFPKKSKCRWAANSDTFLQGRQIAHMIFECFSATETCEVVQRLSTVFAASLQSANVRQMGSSLSVSEMPSWKDCTGQNWRILFNFRLCWQYMINKHKGEWSTIENSCETSCWSDDDNSKLYSPECCCGKGISQRKLSLR